jgi:hypothetical protein
MNINVRVSMKQKGDAGRWLAGFEKRMKGPTAVKVGFPAGTSGRHPGGLVDVVQIAVWNHFGTAGSGKGFSTKRGGGFGGPIPPRPFILIAVFRHRSQIRRLLASIYRDVLAGKTDAVTGLSRLGLYGAGIIQQTISQGVGAANSPTTIRLKGSSKQLIDSGHMRQAVTWALDVGSAAANPAGKRSAAYRAGRAIGRSMGRAARL